MLTREQRASLRAVIETWGDQKSTGQITFLRALCDLDALETTNQRLADLVRYKRHDLHNEGLITNEEYAEILQNPGAVNRLEGYDAIKAERDTLRSQNDQYVETNADLIGQLGNMQTDNADLRARCEQAEALAHKYGEHLWRCDLRQSLSTQCTCGFDAALAALSNPSTGAAREPKRK